MNNLPINEVINDIKLSFATSNKLILQAPPGSGKSTLVPLCFLEENYMQGKKIIVLQPRRVATRSVASRLAYNLKQDLGLDIGYIVKNDNISNKNTKILVVTEAILTRMLQDDQSLSDVAMVIFDEFHERSIHSDLALALCLQVQEILRDDLKILLMSATLNSKDALKVMGDNTKVISSKGKMYDVKDIYLKQNILLNKKNIYTITFDTIINSIKNDSGDILVFLSSVKHINFLQDLLKNKIQNDNILILPLYSQLSKKEQDLAINKNKKRKVILSTNIAQTSLTIDGVRVVIDTGYENKSFYNHNTSMNSLKEQFISIDSSIQRKGRAGRTSSGKCYKIWHQNKILEQSDIPQILRSDLKPLIMDLCIFGSDDFKQYSFINIPKQEFIEQNKLMLKQLNMIDDKSNITSYGKNAIKLGLHPRYAYMILKANDLGYAYEACLLASIFSSNIQIKNDFKSFFIDLYENNISSYQYKNILNDANVYLKKLKSLKNISVSQKKFNINLLGVLVLFAYPDRLCKQRKKDSEFYKLSNGKGAMLKKEDKLFNTQYLVVPSIMANTTNSLIQTAIYINLDFIKTYFNNIIKTKQEVIFDKKSNQISIQKIFYILHLDLYVQKLSLNDISNKKEIFLDLLQKEALTLLNFDKKAKSLQQRVNFVNYNIKDKFPNFTDDYLLQTIKQWIEPYINNISSIKDLQKLNIYEILYSLLTWQEQKELENLAPLFIQVPSKSNIKINYENKQKAILEVKLQEVFGLFDTPKILNNKINLQMHLLSPALRPVAITYDLKSFWDNSYIDVVKDLKNKYKRHYWPQNPYDAIATNKTKKNM